MKVRAAVFWSYGAHAVLSMASIVAVPLFLRAFGQTRYGFWMAMVDVVSYLNLLNLGIAQTVSSRVSHSLAAGDAGTIAATVRRGFLAYSRVCAIVAPVVLVAAWLVPWAEVFHLDAAMVSEARWGAVTATAAILVDLPMSVLRVALQGLAEVPRERAVTVSTTLLRLGVAWLCALFHPTLPVGIAALALCTFTGHIACFLLLRSKLASLRSSPAPVSSTEPSKPIDDGFRSESMNYFLIQIAGAMVVLTDTPITAMMLGAADAARVSVAWRVVMAVLTLGSLVGPAVAPSLVIAWARGDLKSVRATGVSGARDVTAVIAIASLVIFVVGEQLFRVWVGERMFVGRLPWLFYCMYVAIQGILMIPDAFIMQVGGNRRYAQVACIEGVLKIALSLVLMRLIGLAGVPAALLLARAGTRFWYLPVAYSARLEMRTRRWLTLVAWPSGAASLVFLVCYLPARLLVAPTAPVMFAVAGVGAVAFMAVYLRFRSSQDRHSREDASAARPASAGPPEQ